MGSSDTDTGESVIEVSNLRKTYGETVAVDGVSFDIQAEEVFALVGPNGAGKTTTVEMIECLRTPTAGSALVLGEDVTTNAHSIKAEIGVVPQSFHTFDRLSVRENVTLIRRMYDDGLSVDAVLDELDLTEWAETSFQSLSGGLQRRTGMAMALVSDPAVLFLDEPTTGLDPDARRTTWEQIEGLADRGTTVVLTTHYMEEVERLADRAALLLDGRIEAIDTVPNLIDRYGGAIKVVVRSTGESAEDEVFEPILEDAASEVYRTETGDIVGLFEDRGRAQEAYSRLHQEGEGRAIDLISAGMEDVFLQLAGATPDARGEIE
ncbi:ABC-type multidrug transport system, ATPase component [Halorhabdus sp. SVX81]|uniref:ABC transporter ATP-binding protein n=1 Tax=Halorhabdus sp. SVX81 TaxID=2978283 RepID=UPI0023DC090C|nr:ABC transporter ATP-binding protein [Halorhabdus sp. SVX81]WEL17972.1 ABC-type multidrug transport system, ATPase component [Halorhabdus sp. SVX81]